MKEIYKTMGMYLDEVSKKRVKFLDDRTCTDMLSLVYVLLQTVHPHAHAPPMRVHFLRERSVNGADCYTVAGRRRVFMGMTTKARARQCASSAVPCRVFVSISTQR